MIKILNLVYVPPPLSFSLHPSRLSFPPRNLFFSDSNSILSYPILSHAILSPGWLANSLAPGSSQLCHITRADHNTISRRRHSAGWPCKEAVDAAPPLRPSPSLPHRRTPNKGRRPHGHWPASTASVAVALAVARTSMGFHKGETSVRLRCPALAGA